jgi:SNF2 family DNA or RNA helicase
MPPTTLRPYQRKAVDWLGARARGYLGDEPGLGKTRSILEAVRGEEVLVVEPASLRDIRVWEDEAELIDWNGTLHTVSYHSLPRAYESGKIAPHTTLVFDEAHRLKERKVNWLPAANALAAKADRVYLASGTPAPNVATELWTQLRIVDPVGIPKSYWAWVREWFDVVASQYSQYDVPGTLKACDPTCERSADCVHWQAFRQATYAERLMRRLRDDVLKDLPPLSGADHPMLIPMGLEQKAAYKQMKKEFLADLPDGSVLEVLTHTAKFNKLMQLSTGISSASGDPADDKYSAKLSWLSETLPDRDRPTVVGVYYRDTAAAVSRTLDRLKLPYGMIGGVTPQKQRLEIVRAFQRGDLAALIGSVNVMGEGFTLTRADEMYLLERPWTTGAMEQLVRRLHRLGQDRPVSVRQLVTPQSVDHKVQWQGLLAKEAHIGRVLSRHEIEGAL